MLAIFSGYQMIGRKREEKKIRMHLPRDCFATLLVRDHFFFLSVAFDIAKEN